MAKHILRNAENFMQKVCEDDASKDFWLRNGYGNSVEISDADVLALARGHKGFRLNDDKTEKEAHPDNLDETMADGTRFDSLTKDFTQEEIQKNLLDLIYRMEKDMANYKDNPPAIWTTNYNALLSINISSLSYPINGCTCVDCLEKNDIHIPSSMEF